MSIWNARAEELGHDEIVRFLTTNLIEEKAANTKLNTVFIAKGSECKGPDRGLMGYWRVA